MSKAAKFMLSISLSVAMGWGCSAWGVTLPDIFTASAGEALVYEGRENNSAAHVRVPVSLRGLTVFAKHLVA